MEDPNQTQNENPRRHLEILAPFRHIKDKLIPAWWTLQAGIEFKKNLRVHFGEYGGLKLEYFWVVKSKKAK